MSREFSRTRRVAEQMQRELAELVRDELQDPRLGMITISAVEVSRDFGHAKVYVTVLDDARAQESVAVLNHAAGFLRRGLGQRMVIRSVPQLHFHYDASVERGSRISTLIDAAIASDQVKAKDHDQ